VANLLSVSEKTFQIVSAILLFISHILFIFVDNKQQSMRAKKQTLLPKFQKILEQMGENIKLARKRRNLTTIQVAERAGINRSTLYHIEKGNPSVALGAYFNVLRVLSLQDDFLKLAADDEFGRKLQDLKLIGK
jgi:DNA-binding XRE family transcriptional regulator